MSVREETSDTTDAELGDLSEWEGRLHDVLLPLRCRVEPADRSEQNDVSVATLGDATLLGLTLTPQSWSRSRREIRQGKQDHAFTLTILEGDAVVSQDGREIQADKHATVVLDGALPFEFRSTSLVRAVSLVVSRDLFARRCAPLSTIASQVPATPGLALPVSAFVGCLPDAAVDPGLSLIELQRLGSRTLDLMRLVFSQTATTTDVRQQHLARAKAYLEANLTRSDLSPPEIAEGAAVSLRYLHELFKSTGETVSQRIIRRRLDLAYSALTDAERADESVTRIATSCGFKTAAHFSRCFVDRFGKTPTEARNPDRNSDT